MPEILTVPEAARLLRVTPATVYANAALGKIPSFKAGRLVRFRRSDLEAWMAAGRTIDEPELEPAA